LLCSFIIVAQAAEQQAEAPKQVLFKDVRIFNGVDNKLTSNEKNDTKEGYVWQTRKCHCVQLL
jgi:hypothetical protein